MIVHPDESRWGKDAWRHSGVFWYDAATGLWVAASAANPLPVVPMAPAPTATDGVQIQVALLNGTELQLLAADPGRIEFIIVNEGPGTAHIKPVSASWPGNATVNAIPVFRSDSWKEDQLPELEWRVFAEGDILVRGIAYR